MTSFYGEYREKNVISDEEENRVSRANVDKWIFRLFLVLIGFMPLIVMAHTEEVLSPLVTDVSLLTSGTKGDLFTHYKSLLVIIITILTALLLFGKIFFMGGKIKKTKLNYFLGFFAYAIVMSTILSPNISIALNGQYNRSDGALSWLCYIALVFIAMNINYPKKAVNYVMYSLLPFIYINLFIITMNFTGNDLMQKEWMQKLVSIFLPEGANLSAGSQLVGTLNQWNYMSGMFAIMTVMFLTWAIVEKSWIHSIVGLITSVAAIAVMFMSISTSGFVTVLMSLLVIIWIVLKAENKGKATAIFVAFFILTAPVLHVLASHTPNVWKQSFGFFLDNNPYLEKQQSASQSKLDIDFNFDNKAYAADNSLTLPVLPESGWAPGTGRVYIWEKTYELLKEKPLLGYGLDTIMYNFPHYNIDARGGLKTEHTIVDKPHNIYIGIAYGTGFIGLVAFIGFVLYAAFNLFKFIFRQKSHLNFALIVAVTAYFIQALFNDSLPGISGIIFVFLGIAIALSIQQDDNDIVVEK